MTGDVDLAFEREKWQADVRLRERELAIREAEAASKAEELARSRWANPIVLAVFAAAIAAGGSAAVALINGIEQRAADERHAKADNQLQTDKASEEQRLEEGKAEAARILEMIKTNDPDKAAVNLSFLLDTGLIVGDERRKSLAAYLQQRRAGQGPTLPVNLGSPLDLPYFGYSCQLKDDKDVGFAVNAIMTDLSAVANDVDFVQTAPGYISVTHKGESGNTTPNFIRVQQAGPGRVIAVPAIIGQSQATLMATLQNTLSRLSVDPNCARTMGPVRVTP